MNVANKAIIRKLTARFLKAAKTRNIIAVIAIALTSVMFTSVFTIGGNMLGAIEEQTMRQVGISSHGGLKYLTRAQYENFAQSPLIKDISYNIFLAMAENDALKKGQHEIRYSEDESARWQFSFPSVGKMPQTDNEIACSTITLDALGVPHEIGASVPLEFAVGGVRYNETFTLCGFWAGDPVLGVQEIWLGKDYVDGIVADNADTITDMFAGTYIANVWFDSAVDIEDKMFRLIEERGYADGAINYGVNWAYAASDMSVDPTTAAIAALVLALILLSGYLIIYSIFAISVTADIHFFGLLKTIGATGRQIRKIVRGQALYLSAIGIPLGLLLGYFCGAGVTPLMLNMLAAPAPMTASASPLIFIFAAAFSLLTVFIGCRKPAKLASRVSPVEAVTYSGVSDRGGRKAKRTRRVTSLSMAWANVTREKRKLAVTVLSLSLAMILLNSAYSATKSFDMDAYVSGSIISDFAVADYSVFSNVVRIKNVSGVTADFLEEAASHGGEISNIYNYNRSLPGDPDVMQVYGVGQPELASFSDVDYDKLRSGDYAIVSRAVIAIGDGVSIPQVGETITLINDSGATRAFEVIGLVDEYPHSVSARFRFGNSLDVIIADSAFLDFYGERQPMQTNVNVAAENLSAFETWLADYTERINPDLDYISRETLKAEFDGLRTAYLALGGSLSFILALVGVLNFINAIAASVIARRREFAMLGSVGMTSGQLRRTLFFEGGCHAALSLVFTLTVGTGLGLLITQAVAGQVWFFERSFTALPSLICAVPLFLICAAAPLICYRRLTRESLVERLGGW